MLKELGIKYKHAKAYMECAEVFARCSTANRLKVGAVIVKNNRVISCGYNAMPEHIDDSCENESGHTDVRVRHAEKNALVGILKSNNSSENSIMFCNYSCCALCAIDIVEAGIKAFIYKNEYRCDGGLKYLIDNGVKVLKWEDLN